MLGLRARHTPSEFHNQISIIATVCVVNFIPQTHSPSLTLSLKTKNTHTDSPRVLMLLEKLEQGNTNLTIV